MNLCISRFEPKPCVLPPFQDGLTVPQNSIFAGATASAVDDELGEIGVSMEAQGAYMDGVIEQVTLS